MEKDFPYNIKPKHEWEAKNKEWNILAYTGKLECDDITCGQCKWYVYCEFYQIKEESE